MIGIPYSRLGSFLAKRIRAFHSGDLSGNRVTRPADLSGDLGPGQTFLDQVSKFLRILFGPRSHLLNSNHFQGPRTRLNAPLQNGADMALRDIVLAAELVRSACAMHREGKGGDGVGVGGHSRASRLASALARSRSDSKMSSAELNALMRLLLWLACSL